MKRGRLVLFCNTSKFLVKSYKRLYRRDSCLIDGSFPFRAETIHGYVQGLHISYLQSFYKENFGIDITSDTNIILRYR